MTAKGVALATWPVRRVPPVLSGASQGWVPPVFGGGGGMGYIQTGQEDAPSPMYRQTENVTPVLQRKYPQLFMFVEKGGKWQGVSQEAISPVIQQVEPKRKHSPGGNTHCSKTSNKQIFGDPHRPNLRGGDSVTEANQVLQQKSQGYNTCKEYDEMQVQRTLHCCW